MATLPDDPKPGQTYRLDPDDGTRILYDPSGDDDDIPWDVTWPSKIREWHPGAHVETLPGGELVPATDTETAW